MSKIIITVFDNFDKYMGICQLKTAGMSMKWMNTKWLSPLASSLMFGYFLARGTTGNLQNHDANETATHCCFVSEDQLE